MYNKWKMEFLKKFTMFVVSLLVVSLAVAEPGNREDQTPWFGYGSLPEHIVGLAFDLEELKQDRNMETSELRLKRDADIAELEAKALQAPFFGMPMITDSKEDFETAISDTRQRYSEKLAKLEAEYSEKLNQQNESIVNSLASPSSAEAREKAQYAKDAPNKERLEIHNALQNAQEIVALLNAELRLNKSDEGVAARTYTAQANMIKISVSMHELFIRRVDTIYKKNIKNHQRETKSSIKDAKSEGKDLGKAFAERRVKRLKRIYEHDKRILKQLDAFKKDAVARRQLLVKSQGRAQALLREALLAKESNTFVSLINDDIEKLEFVIPELIEFDYVPEEFDAG